MADGISATLQSNLLQLSDLIYQQDGTIDQKKPGVGEEGNRIFQKNKSIEELGNKVLEEISKESPNISSSSKQYLEKISAAISVRDWDKIPPPSKLQAALKELSEVRSAVQSAMPSATVDIYALFRVLMEHKRTQKLGLAELSIQDSAQAIKLSSAQFDQQAVTNKWQLGSDLATAGIQTLAATGQGISSARSIKQNVSLLKENEANIRQVGDIQKFKNDRANAIAEQEQLDSDIKLAGQKIAHLTAANPNDPQLFKLNQARTTLINKRDDAQNIIKQHTAIINQYDSTVQIDSARIRSKTEIATYNDQIRSAVINGTKGVLDMANSVVKFAGSNAKLDADRLDSAKNLTDKSSSALLEASRNAGDDLKSFMQTLSGIEQSLSSSMSNSLRA
jgi:hypothetical protein